MRVRLLRCRMASTATPRRRRLAGAVAAEVGNSERQSTMGAAGRSLPSMVASGGLLTPSGSELGRLAFDRCSPLRLRHAYFCCSLCFGRAL
jgi:hypothetical protein